MTAVPWQKQLNFEGEKEELERQEDHEVSALKRRKELFLSKIMASPKLCFLCHSIVFVVESHNFEVSLNYLQDC